MEHQDMTGISILFVDDEKLIRNSFARELRAVGFKVTTAASGGEAIGEVERTRYDLVVTDLMMPDVDGFGVLKAVKRHAPQTCVIILTGYGDLQSANDALRLGADDFTLKPCEVDDLIFRIRRCLEKHRLLRLLASQSQQQLAEKRR
jgi:DNA-binding NtrC family response regulator